MAKNPLTYASSGVNYKNLDSIKVSAQKQAALTSSNINSDEFNVVEASRGESAFVWEEPDSYRALVIESLGTKSLIAEEVYKRTGELFYSDIAQDTVAMIINDLIVVGAKPLALNAYFGLGDSEWLYDIKRTESLIPGFKKACDIARCAWGGGETPSLTGIINPNTIDLAGSATGIIKPKSRLTLGDKISEGDSIIFIESNGIHANGVSIVRKIADSLPNRYETKLPSGTTLGKSILRPTHIYSEVIQSLFKEDIDIHYMVNLTGHGFMKIMRANREYTYQINNVPALDELFEFIRDKSGMPAIQMYGTFNMGVGFVIIVNKKNTEKALKLISKSFPKALVAGKVVKGKKQVKVDTSSLHLTFVSEDFNIR